MRAGELLPLREGAGEPLALREPLSLKLWLAGGEGVPLPEAPRGGEALTESLPDTVGAPVSEAAPEGDGGAPVAVPAGGEGVPVAQPVPVALQEGDADALRKPEALPLPLPRREAEALPEAHGERALLPLPLRAPLPVPGALS